MKLGAIALDYDGTTRDAAGLHPEVRAAVEEARLRGVAVLLVTGRRLPELERELGDLRLFDAVVGENGALVSFPGMGRARRMAPPPPPAFLARLGDLGVGFETGECVVEMDAEHAPVALAAIRELELPLVLQFNRGRLMVLPQAISKATGLSEALEALRLSPHNTVAIGDAENDHELLRTAEVGVAVAWGSPALQRAADRVLPGTGPAAVAAFVRRAVNDRRVLPDAPSRRVLTLGATAGGTPIEHAVRGRNLLVAGDPQSGKSWIAGLVAEQMLLMRYSLCAIDPEGDYLTLEALPGVVIAGGRSHPPDTADVLRALRHPDLSVVVDLSQMSASHKRETARTLLLAIADQRRRTGLPHAILVDEAHDFVADPGMPARLGFEQGGYLLVTYRASKLAPEVMRGIQSIVVTRESDPAEVHVLAERCGACGDERAWRAWLGGLGLDEAALLPLTEEARGGVLRFKIGPRLTHHVRHRHKYMDVPVPGGRAFAFTRRNAPTGETARTLRELVEAVARVPAEVLDGHLRRGDFSRWILEVFADHELAHEIARVEAGHAAARISDPAARIARRVAARYELGAASGGPAATAGHAG